MDETKCNWIVDFDWDIGGLNSAVRSMVYWGTSCGKVHAFLSGSPKSNQFKICPFCGKKLSQKETKNAD